MLLAAAVGTAPALADPGMFGAAVSGANTAIKNAENAQAQVIHLPDGTIAQVPPVTQSKGVGPQAQGVGLPTGLTYTLDASVAHSLGNTGKFGDKWLPGGMDAVLGYGFGPHTRLVANYYELQHYPVGFNSGQVPLYLPPGFPTTPGVNPSCVDLSGSGSASCPGIPSPIDVTTKDKFALFMFEQLIDLGTVGHGEHAHTVPLVITPTYVSRWSYVAGSNNGSDVVPFVDANGVAHTNINTRTAQVYSVAVTLPFLKTPKMFGTFTVAPSWLVHTAGLNQQNHAQLYQILYLEYTPTNDMRIFIEPQSSRDYLPTDPYAQHLAAYFVGVSQRIAKYGFVQVVLNSGGPTNYSPYGVKQLNCVQLPCSQNTLPTVGGLKATQVQIQFGIGSPSVIQF
jgi:hypothetical protein